MIFLSSPGRTPFNVIPTALCSSSLHSGSELAGINSVWGSKYAVTLISLFSFFVFLQVISYLITVSGMTAAPYFPLSPTVLILFFSSYSGLQMMCRYPNPSLFSTSHSSSSPPLDVSAFRTVFSAVLRLGLYSPAASRFILNTRRRVILEF